VVSALAAFAVAYLLGSIPFSLFVARAFGVADLRRVGSGNVGATNVLRAAGKRAGALALALDVAKGASATLLATRLAPGSEVVAPLAAVAAVLGHMHPVWLRFRGGKGVATGVGAFAPLAPWPAVGGLVAFALALAATRIASVGSMVGAATLAVLVWVTVGRGPLATAAAFTAVLVILQHRSNLARLRHGTEPRLGASKR
jgi:glycerol-3-phosphate acyltransferase PlsY